MTVEIRQLGSDDLHLMDALARIFGEAFNQVDVYTAKRPSDGYLQNLLADETFVALAAVSDREVVGGLAAYELRKFEQERSEYYLYDLAVAASHRREGIATALIERLKRLAAVRGAYVIFVQADTEIEDEPAIALYSKLGSREDVLHFDIAVDD